MFQLVGAGFRQGAISMNLSITWEDLVEAAWELGQLARARGVALVTAESCTGGMIAQLLTERGGSSAWFERGFVTYSNAAKAQSLGVSVDVLREFGAVSEPVARAMAQGALRNSMGQLAIAVTGIAGPAGGTEDKPVGTVCFAWADAQRVESATQLFAGDRMAVRHASAGFALARARMWLGSDTSLGLLA
jgi:nicotinamide-nucleotide amidase